MKVHEALRIAERVDRRAFDAFLSGDDDVVDGLLRALDRRGEHEARNVIAWAWISDMNYLYGGYQHVPEDV